MSRKRTMFGGGLHEMDRQIRRQRSIGIIESHKAINEGNKVWKRYGDPLEKPARSKRKVPTTWRRY